MDIKEVSSITNIPISTIRYYQKKGLINAVFRIGSTYHYTSEVLDKITIISLAQEAGLNLNEIEEMLLPKGKQADKESALSKAEELDTCIKKMQAVRDGLRDVASCEDSNHLACPKFRRLLLVANARDRLVKGFPTSNQ